MKLTSQMIKDKAKELGVDCIAIGNIERFKDAPELMSPLTYFPKAKSVIAVAMRIPRGTYRGIEEGTHWHNYTFYSYNKLNTFFRPKRTYELCCFIEDHGWEAVAHYPAVPEGNGVNREPVAEGKVPADVVCSVRIIAAGCGLGEVGYSKVFLNDGLFFCKLPNNSDFIYMQIVKQACRPPRKQLPQKKHIQRLKYTEIIFLC